MGRLKQKKWTKKFRIKKKKNQEEFKDKHSHLPPHRPPLPQVALSLFILIFFLFFLF
jgi:hypothetical protein